MGLFFRQFSLKMFESNAAIRVICQVVHLLVKRFCSYGKWRILVVQRYTGEVVRQYWNLLHQLDLVE